MTRLFSQQEKRAIHSIAHPSHVIKGSILILLLVSAATSDGLSCIAQEKPWIRKPFADLVLDDFMQKTTSKNITDGHCQVRIHLDYGAQVLSIEFTEDLPTSWLSLGKVKFGTMVIPLGDSVYVENQVEYVCAKDGCELVFLNDHLPWLRQTGYRTLAQHVLPLITRNTNGSTQCFEKGFKSNECATRLCHLRVLHYGGKDSTEPMCAAPDGYLSPKLGLTYFIDVKDLTMEYMYDLYCDHADCNGPEIVGTLVSTIEIEHDMPEMLEILASRKESEEKQEEETTTTTTTTTIQRLTNSATIESSALASTTQRSSTLSFISTVSGSTSQHRTSISGMSRGSTMKNNGQHCASGEALAYALYLCLVVHILFCEYHR